MDHHYGQGVKKMATSLGVKATDVVTGRLRELESILSEKEDEYEGLQDELNKQTSRSVV